MSNDELSAEGRVMRIVNGDLQPGEEPKWHPNREPIILPSFNLQLARDGRITIYVPKRPEFGDPTTSRRIEAEVLPGKQQSWTITHKTGEMFVVTVERKPSNIITIGQAKRVLQSRR